jgi:predicted metalloprotease with PDZ domain
MKKLSAAFQVFFTLTFYVMAQSLNISYELSMPKPSSHIFEVEIVYDGITDDFIELILPVWRPGRYLIFDFASGVTGFRAFGDNGESLKWHKVNKFTWRVETKIAKGKYGKIAVKYSVYANEFELRTRGLDYAHGFVNGTAVFMYSEKYRGLQVALKVNPYNDWHVTTALENADNSPNVFIADEYDYLADCPLEIGTQDDFEFEVDGKRHIISLAGAAFYDKDTLVNDLRRIVGENLKFWGRLPYQKYVFIIHTTPNFGGGTEHINSTVVGVRPSFFEKPDSYKNFLRLISHEFFHTWNVKQIRPKGLTPYDYTKENYTEELWIAEGATSYYDGLILLRTGQCEIEDFFDEIARAVEEERRRPGNKVQSVAESSFDAWVKFWKRTPQSYNTETDYYGKGADVSLILDLEIRNLTESKHSLDDVFRKMFEDFPLGSPGYTNADLMKACNEISGKDFQKFFDDYVYGTKEIDWEKYLSYAGLMLKSKDSTFKPVIGLDLGQSGQSIVVENVVSGSPAEDAGIEIGDEILAIDDLKINYRDLDKKLDKLQTGDKIKITAFRNDKLREFTLTLQSKKAANYDVERAENPTEHQKSIFEDWLKTKF